MECTSDKCKSCDFLNKCRFSKCEEAMKMEQNPEHSCLTCKYENKDICEEPCMDCKITLGNDKWEEKNETGHM